MSTSSMPYESIHSHFDQSCTDHLQASGRKPAQLCADTHHGRPCRHDCMDTPPAKTLQHQSSVHSQCVKGYWSITIICYAYRHPLSNSKCTGMNVFFNGDDAAHAVRAMHPAQGHAHHHPLQPMPPHGVGPWPWQECEIMPAIIRICHVG